MSIEPYSGQKKAVDMTEEEKAAAWLRSHEGHGADGLTPGDRELAERAAAFADATQKKGMPMTYGAKSKDAA